MRGDLGRGIVACVRRRSTASASGWEYLCPVAGSAAVDRNGVHPGQDVRAGVHPRRRLVIAPCSRRRSPIWTSAVGPSFIRSSSTVRPARNWAPGSVPARTASGTSAARRYWKGGHVGLQTGTRRSNRSHRRTGDGDSRASTTLTLTGGTSFRPHRDAIGLTCWRTSS